MLRTALLCLMLALAVIPAGCIEMTPPYPKEMLTFDEGLLGNWSAGKVGDKDSPPVPVTVERREVVLRNGKLQAAAPLANLFPGAAREERVERLPAYRLVFEVKGEGAKVSKHRFDAVLLDMSGVKILAMQIAEDEEAIKEKIGAVLPVHWTFKIERQGDTVTAWNMKAPIVWMPAVKALGQPEGPLKLPKDQGLWLVTDSAQFITLLKEAAGSKDCWEKDGLTAVRVK